MIVELRRYTLKPGQLAPYLGAYGEKGYAVQRRHLGPALGWFVVDVGPQNQVVHLWTYESLAAMERQRAAMAADPDWLAIKRGMIGMFAAQETSVMTMVPNLHYTSGVETPRLVDIRTYTVHHGKLPELMQFLRDEASAIQARHWPDNVAYLASSIGALNRIVHIWGHHDHAERLARRQALLADPDWQRCLKTILPMLADMETMTAVPAPFWGRPNSIE